MQGGLNCLEAAAVGESPMSRKLIMQLLSHHRSRSISIAHRSALKPESMSTHPSTGRTVSRLGVCRESEQAECIGETALPAGTEARARLYQEVKEMLVIIMSKGQLSDQLPKLYILQALAPKPQT